MKKYLMLMSLILAGSAQAAGTIDYLEVDNDVVLFSTTEAKSAASPACVSADKADLWSASLSSDSGRAIYSLILTTMAKGEGVGLSITSAQDCAGKIGVERASNVSLTQQEVTPASAPTPTAQHTIMNNLMEINSHRLVSRSGDRSSSPEYFQRLGQFGSGKNLYGTYSSNTKKRLASVSGSGWITSIILPAAEAAGSTVNLEIVVDGELHTFSPTSQFNNVRYSMAVTDGIKDGYLTYSLLSTPEQVVSMGKGIPYMQSFEVWVQMDYPARTDHRYWAIQYLPGYPN